MSDAQIFVSILAFGPLALVLAVEIMKRALRWAA